jgi:hypothetical protein
MNEQLAAPVAPAPGAENAIPWPTPMLPDTAMLTFRGYGSQSTAAFVLPGDASVRIAAERGPFVLRVIRPDGTDAVSPAKMPYGGLGLGAIPAGGTYTLEVRTAERWGITVVFAAPK